MRGGEDGIESLKLVAVGFGKELSFNRNQRSTCKRLKVKRAAILTYEVYHRNERDVKAEENEIRFPRNLVDHDRSQLHDGVVEEPVRDRGNACCFGADPDGGDFRGI